MDTRDIKLIEIVLTIIIDTDIDLLESIYYYTLVPQNIYVNLLNILANSYNISKPIEKKTICKCLSLLINETSIDKIINLTSTKILDGILEYSYIIPDKVIQLILNKRDKPVHILLTDHPDHITIPKSFPNSLPPSPTKLIKRFHKRKSSPHRKSTTLELVSTSTLNQSINVLSPINQTLSPSLMQPIQKPPIIDYQPPPQSQSQSQQELEQSPKQQQSPQKPKSKPKSKSVINTSVFIDKVKEKQKETTKENKRKKVDNATPKQKKIKPNDSNIKLEFSYPKSEYELFTNYKFQIEPEVNVSNCYFSIYPSIYKYLYYRTSIINKNK